LEILLNKILRYVPVIEFVRHATADGQVQTILEVGSGARGLGTYLDGSFFGCDITFEEPPLVNMRPVIASAATLPFDDRAFDLVVSVDMIEHISPEGRGRVLQEISRVARRYALIACPQGRMARRADEFLAAYYRARSIQRPSWLQEHLQGLYPTNHEIVAAFPNLAWQSRRLGNENVFWHWMMMIMETQATFRNTLAHVQKAAPMRSHGPTLDLARGLAHLVSIAPPFYRTVHIFTRIT